MFACLHRSHSHRGIFTHSKKPIDPETHGYTLEKQGWLEADTWHIWKVNNATNKFGVLDKIGVDPIGNRMCIFDADNQSDKFPEDKKLRLRDLMIGIWTTKHGKKPEDLQRILVQSTVAEDIQKLRDRIYTIMKESDKAKTMTIKVDGASNEEKEAYQMLTHEFPFGHGVRHMLEEYKGLKGKRIVEFVLAQPPYQSLQFDIVIN
ncbi:hypothetical protein BJX61DRAFT_539342 [Aspergillus egyptiacus]|nr:hypothetical protein BJX61DRAFT_539342 [Aspergillus egyptiacus]